MNGIPYLTGASNIINGKININRWTTSPKSIANIGSVLLTCKGTVGLTSILDGIDKVHIARQFMALKPIKIFNKFLKLIIDSFSCSLKSDATSMIPGVSREQVLSLMLALPPIKEQIRIIDYIEKLTDKIYQIDKASNDLEENIQLAKSKLLDLAIRGKLLPQNKDDEPASKLLERIRKEKGSAQTTTKGKRKTVDSYIFKGGDNLYYEQIGSETKCIQDKIPFDIPNSWAWTRLESIVIINPKNDAEETTEVSFVPMSKIKDGLSNEFSYDIKKWGEVKKGYTHFANGDIGFAKITPCFENKKSVVFTKLKNGIGAGTTELFVLRPYISSVLSDFILAYVKRDAFISDGIKSFNGVVGQQRISSEFVKNSLFPLPPAEEQARICEFLTSAFTKLDSLAQH